MPLDELFIFCRLMDDVQEEMGPCSGGPVISPSAHLLLSHRRHVNKVTAGMCEVPPLHAKEAPTMHNHVREDMELCDQASDYNSMINKFSSETGAAAGIGLRDSFRADLSPVYGK